MSSLFAKFTDQRRPDASETKAQAESRSKAAEVLEQAFLQLHQEATDQMVDLHARRWAREQLGAGGVKKEARKMRQAIGQGLKAWRAQERARVRSDNKLKSVLLSSHTLAVKQEELSHFRKFYLAHTIRTGVTPWWAESALQHRQRTRHGVAGENDSVSPPSATHPTSIGSSAHVTLAPDTFPSASAIPCQAPGNEAGWHSGASIASTFTEERK
jgi:hypothetical protein